MQKYGVLVCLTMTTMISPTVSGQSSSSLLYDGRTTVARIRFEANGLGGCSVTDSPGGPGWGHDFPMSVQGLMKAATKLTHIEASVDKTIALRADDPELMRHPIAMLTEPGCWSPKESEVKALRAYLLKGGFLIVDDPTLSKDDHASSLTAIKHFEGWMKQVLPNARLMRVGEEDPIFDVLFRVHPEEVPGLSWKERGGEVYAVYQDNDPTRHAMVIANYYTRIGENWRYARGLGSGLGSGPGEKAYKLGLNYLVYGLLW